MLDCILDSFILVDQLLIAISLYFFNSIVLKYIFHISLANISIFSSINLSFLSFFVEMYQFDI